jgi:hypothetical protein
VSRLQDLMLQAVLGIALLLALWFVAHSYGAEKYDAGYAAAVAAGQAQHDSEAVAAQAIESGLRAKLLDRDTEALRKDQEHAQALADAQRRMRNGTDSLRCPAASPVHEAATPSSGPAAADAGIDGTGPAIVPETAADLLGIAGDVASLVSRYQQVVDRFDACRAVNAQ